MDIINALSKKITSEKPSENQFKIINNSEHV